MKNNAAYSSVAQITRSADSCRSPFRVVMVVVTMLMDEYDDQCWFDLDMDITTLNNDVILVIMDDL